MATEQVTTKEDREAEDKRRMREAAERAVDTLEDARERLKASLAKRPYYTANQKDRKAIAQAMAPILQGINDILAGQAVEDTSDISWE